MKQIFILLLTVFALNVNAQFTYEFQYETPDTATASQTHYIYPTGTTGATEIGYEKSYSLAIIVKVDSLSGATAGTGYIEVACDEAGTIWAPISTATTVINGPSSIYIVYDDNDFSFYKWRYRITNSAATQSNRSALSWGVKRKQ